MSAFSSTLTVSTVYGPCVRPWMAEVPVAHLWFPRIRPFGEGKLVCVS